MIGENPLIIIQLLSRLVSIIQTIKKAIQINPQKNKGAASAGSSDTGTAAAERAGPPGGAGFYHWRRLECIGGE